MIALWIFVEILLGISLAFIVNRYAVIVGLVLTVAGVAPAVVLTIYTSLDPPTRDMSAESMLSTLILVLVTPVGIAALVIGLLRRI